MVITPELINGLNSLLESETIFQAENVRYHGN